MLNWKPGSVFSRALERNLRAGACGLALALAANGAAQTNWVTQATDAALRSAMAGGGTVSFACNATITLTAPLAVTNATVLIGTGHDVTISGGGNVGLFGVTNAALTLVDLLLMDGSSPYGGAIYLQGGTVTLLRVIFDRNSAVEVPVGSGPGAGYLGGSGGAIWNSGGTACATNCLFFGNICSQTPTSVVASVYAGTFPTSPCVGGAIANEGGTVALHNCTFVSNGVQGGPGPQGEMTGVVVEAFDGRSGYGGAVYNSGQLAAAFCTFTGNSAGGGWAVAQPAGLYGFEWAPSSGPNGGDAAGAAVYNQGTMLLSDCQLSGNGVAGGEAGAGEPGKSGSGESPSTGPGEGGVGGNGGGGCGGAIFNSATAALVNCTVAQNTASGGAGAVGGQGGAWSGPTLYAPGGQGGNGGSASGGIYTSGGVLTLTNCTLAGNCATAGGAGAGGPFGGPATNPGPPGTNGWAAGAINGGALVNTLLSTNSPANGFGPLIDAGHNLSSDASCAFANPGSRNSTDPKLGPLAFNGGFNFTMALLAGSPAINAADPASAPPTDQRGFPRPIGPAPAIGAYEYGSPGLLQIAKTSPAGLEVSVLSVPGQTVWMLASTNLANWFPIATNQITAGGTWLFQQSSGVAPARYYRLELP
jgi:hypothetical protein